MLTIFNRRELFVTFSEETLRALKGALDDAGIPCHIKYNAPAGRSSSHARGTAFQNLSASREYKIYVYAKDYDRAFVAVQRAL